MFKSWATVISEQCQEIKQAVASCAYFESWEAEEIAECCRVSSIMEYSSDQIILGPDIGNSYSVFFILEGVCKMVQHLQVKIERSFHGIEVYKIGNFSDSKTLNFNSTGQKFSSRLFNRKDFCGEKLAGEIPVRMEEEQNDLMTNQTSSEKNGAEEEKEEGKIRGSEEEKEDRNTTGAEASDPHVEGSNKPKKSEGSVEEQPSVENITQGETLRNGKEQQDNPKLDLPTQQESQISALPVNSESRGGVAFEPNCHLKILEECIKKRKETGLVCRKGSLPEKSKNVKGFFVQTGLLFKGACFGLEKCEKQNFIISATKVKCLAIPKRFLFKHKPCYIWDKIRLFHSLYLPKDEGILEHLRTDRVWIRNKKRLSKEIVSSKSIPNYTLINEVPYSMRLEDIKATVFSIGDAQKHQKYKQRTNFYKREKR